MFLGEARSLLKSREPERHFPWVISSLTYKHLNKRERLARDKHSSLLQKSVNYGQNRFITLTLGVLLVIKADAWHRYNIGQRKRKVVLKKNLEKTELKWFSAGHRGRRLANGPFTEA